METETVVLDRSIGEIVNQYLTIKEQEQVAEIGIIWLQFSEALFKSRIYNRERYTEKDAQGAVQIAEALLVFHIHNLSCIGLGLDTKTKKMLWQTISGNVSSFVDSITSSIEVFKK